MRSCPGGGVRRDSKRPIDGLAGEQHGTRAAGEDGPVVLDRVLIVDKRPDEPAGDLWMRIAKKGAPLRAGKRAAVQGDKRDPFGLAVGPSEGGK